MKEFISAGSDEKKAVFSKLEDEVEKLSGSAARLSFLHCLVIITTLY